MINRLTFTPMAEKIDYHLDNLLDQLLTNHKIIYIKRDNEFFLTVKFSNNVLVKFWNVNKYHAWMMEGTVFFVNDDKQYSWDFGRPKRKTMCKMIDALSNFK